MRIFYFVADQFPVWRVDLVELFAVQLRALGVATVWQVRRNDAGWAKQADMHGQRAWLPLSLGRKHLLAKALNRPLELVTECLIFLRLLFGARFDVIQVRDDRYTAALFALLAARLRGARFTYWLSFPFPEHDLAMADESAGLRRLFLRLRGKLARWWLYRFILPAADHVFVQSAKMRQNLAAMGIPEENMTPVPMGIPPRLLDLSVRQQAEEVPGQIIYLGTLAASRRLETLIEAFALVRQSHPQATLLMVGEGDFPHERARLEQRAVELGIADAVRFTGFLPMEEAWRLVMTSAVCVSPIARSPTLDVGSPTKLIEYLALAKPTVANRHPEQTEVLEDSRAGILADWGALPFADGIRRILGDPAAARTEAAQGPDWVRAHRSYEHIAATVFARYAAMLPPCRSDDIAFKGEK
ncbi:MAG: glycosyltransferase [Rhodocyclaceae bacterium]|nr:glycosyltransferase [Rhodocyclaceae bacterium]